MRMNCVLAERMWQFEIVIANPNFVKNEYQ